jgi:hypothetical protein
MAASSSPRHSLDQNMEKSAVGKKQECYAAAADEQV